MLEEHTHTGFLERLIAALGLDLQTYAAVARDRNSTAQAVVVVLLSGMCNGLGLARRLGTLGVGAGIGAAVLGWFLWTAVILAMAALFRNRRHGSLLRSLGFATAPGVFLLFGIVPGVGSLVRVGVVVWLLAATAVAVQAVYAVTRRRAWLISLFAFAAYLLVGVVSGYVATL